MWLVILMMRLIFSYKLLLTYIQVLRLRKAFANGSSAKIKLLKTELSKVGQLERLLGPVLKNGFHLMKVEWRNEWYHEQS